LHDDYLLRQIKARPARDRKVRPGRVEWALAALLPLLRGRVRAFLVFGESGHPYGPTEVPVLAGCIGGALSQRENAWLPVAAIFLILSCDPITIE